LIAGVAEVLPALDTVGAFTAGGYERKNNVVARLSVGHAGPHLFHDARPFMSQHHWERVFAVSFHVMQVAVAHAAGSHLDQDLMLVRGVQLQVLDYQRLETFV
jgi:hypothetical protein